MRDRSAVARGARVVFVDADAFPEGTKVTGLYKVEGGKVTVRVTLTEDKKEAQRFTVEGKPDGILYDVKTDVKVTAILLGLYTKVCTRVTGRVTHS